MNAKNFSNELFRELERLAQASKVGNFNFALDDGGLSRDEVETARMINEIINNYKTATEYEITERKQMAEALERREAMLDALNKTATVFISRRKERFEDMMSSGIVQIIDLIDIDRFSLFRNFMMPDGLHASQIFRWDKASGGTTPPTDYYSDVTYAAFAPNWERILRSGNVVNSPARLLSAQEAATLNKAGVISVFVVPLFFDDTFWGFAIFEDRRNERFFEDNAAETMRSAAFLFANTVIHAEMEREIAEANERLKLMLDSTPLCCQLFDSRFNMIDCNQEAIRLFGFKDKQEYLERYSELYPEYQPDGQRSDDKIPVYLKKAFEEGSCSFDWTYNMLDGTTMPAEVTLIRVKHRDGYVLTGYTRDLRKYNKMMGDIEYQNNLLNTLSRVSAALLEPDVDKFEDNLLHAMSLLAKSVDVDRVYIWKNFIENDLLCCTQIYEWTENADLPREPDFTISTVYRDVIPGWEEHLSRGNCINGIVRELSPKEQAELSPQGILSILVVPVFLQEKFWGFIGFDDCRRERKFSKDEEMILRSASRLITNALFRQDMARDLTSALNTANIANRAKSDFLAKMSHEIRTPLNAIIGMTELALREKSPEVMKEYALTVKHAGLNLLAIINDILDLSKIETGKLEIINENYSFSSLINDVIGIIRTRLMDSQILFAVNTDSNIPGAMLGDETRIRQTLLNVLSNAVKYTEKGFVSLTAHAEFVDENAVNLVFEVMDSGIGIKPEDMDKLFDDFTQFDLDKNKGIEGVGLGLSITRSLVKAMGGIIDVRSEYGKGSAFTITLPQKYDSRKALAAVKKPKNKRALIFEQRELYANSIVNTVLNLGVDCTLVTDDSELYEKIRSRSYGFLFIPFLLYTKNKDIISRYGNNIKVAVLAEIRDAVADKSLNLLAMPVYSVSIANILNGVSDSFIYENSNELIVRFTAPGVKVLVVDDINTNLKVVEGLMMPYNMRVDLCKNGVAAINAMRSKDYDLVFMDHKMPEMDGVEATLRIREMGTYDQYFRNVPIVALTANAVSGTREMFLKNGFDDFLSKPIDTVQMNAILEKWIPRNKREGYVGINTDDETKIIEIDGLDIKKGFALSGGKTELYKNTISAFYSDALEKIKEMKKCLEANNIPLYTTYVHGLKGAAAIIGAVELSQAAHALEMAGNRRDLAFINKHAAEFVQSLETLLGNIHDWLKAEKTEESAFDTEEMKSRLAKLKTALNSLNTGVIHNTVDSLIKLTQASNVNAIIRKISHNILLFEYDEAVALIDTLCGGACDADEKTNGPK